jgi:hypothetical protein
MPLKKKSSNDKKFIIIFKFLLGLIVRIGYKQIKIIEKNICLSLSDSQSHEILHKTFVDYSKIGWNTTLS